MQVAYKTIRSRRKFIKAPQIKKCLGAKMDKVVKPHFIQRFDMVVANWDHKPEVQARKFIKLDSLSINVFPAGEHKQIYIFVTGGTKPHKIPTAGPSFLSFMLG